MHRYSLIIKGEQPVWIEIMFVNVKQEQTEECLHAKPNLIFGAKYNIL